MSPIDILKLVRDGVIVAALTFVVWWIRHDGVNSAKVEDLKAIQSQLADNALRQQQYAQEARDAQAQYSHDAETISAAIASHADQPIRLCVSPSSSPVRPLPSTTPGQPAGSGGTHEAARDDSASTIDIRSAVSQFELTYETALNDCRQALASWPH